MVKRKKSSGASQLVHKHFLLLLILFILGAFVLWFVFLVFKGRPVSKEKENPKYSITNIWGEPAKDMYPHLTNPSYVSVKEASEFVKDEDEVIGIKDGDEYKIFPNFILAFHHVVNETVNGIPMMIAYCCQSDSAYAYSRVIDGKTYEFAALGPMYYGNKVLYDLETESYFTQLTGEAFYGKLSGAKLNVALPLVRSHFQDVKNLPIKVLKPEKEITFYREWFERMREGESGLFALRQTKEEDKRLPPYTRGIGLRINNEQKFYPLGKLGKSGEMRDKIGEMQVRIVFDDQVGAFRVFGADEYTQVYWYAWAAFYPKTSIYDK